ncbi:hypothetical protein SAMN06295885_3169 [Rathayibacter oskolensis]|uniref:Uncharacterized protein n=1 Tax=Rathayibacter oskolensis TaxID=1891671 RepID=A0A1X7PCN7_9MICO|nr:hypothetical protein [Rathayibacter oskolensis]SMH48986.1 hypothetical protein SAMN06295885_3169 [Rathayibacter oskolensis]
MERVDERTSPAGPAASFALAAFSAACFGVAGVIGPLNDDAETLYMLSSLLGWAVLVWAVVIGGVHAALLFGRAVSRRPVSLAEAALVAGALALVVVVVTTHPLWGSGSSVA